jgi:restriction system protein
LSKLRPDRESFKLAIGKAYPDDKLGAVPVNAGQLFRFTHEAKIGDLVLYSSKMDRQVHIGRIEGNYEYKLF